ncbi:mucin-1-like [Watersipora subatra]|uniref:mucin-1-like n=1 Tax=Watersipora subatra TaxID=2589382 RepID=UPI00355C525C
MTVSLLVYAVHNSGVNFHGSNYCICCFDCLKDAERSARRPHQDAGERAEQDSQSLQSTTSLSTHPPPCAPPASAQNLSAHGSAQQVMPPPAPVGSAVSQSAVALSYNLSSPPSGSVATTSDSTQPLPGMGPLPAPPVSNQRIPGAQPRTDLIVDCESQTLRSDSPVYEPVADSALPVAGPGYTSLHNPIWQPYHPSATASPSSTHIYENGSAAHASGSRVSSLTALPAGPSSATSSLANPSAIAGSQNIIGQNSSAVANNTYTSATPFNQSSHSSVSNTCDYRSTEVSSVSSDSTLILSSSPQVSSDQRLAAGQRQLFASLQVSSAQEGDYGSLHTPEYSDANANSI